MSSMYSRAAAVALSLLLLTALVPLSVLGDEGMFLPDTLNKLPLKNYNNAD